MQYEKLSHPGKGVCFFSSTPPFDSMSYVPYDILSLSKGIKVMNYGICRKQN